MVCFISQHFLWNQYAIPLQALELHRLSWLSPFSKAFIKIYYFPKFYCQFLGPSKVTFCSIFYLFLTNTLCKIFWITSTTDFAKTIFRSFFEDTTYTAKSLKCHICNTFCIEISTLLAIFNNKGLRNFKVSVSHSILKGMDAS